MSVTNELEAQKRVYATWAKFYDKIYQRLLSRAQREAVDAACACGPDILEIGVGTGLTLAYFTPQSRVVGADLAAAAKGDAIKAELHRRTDEAIARGIFGAPACFVEGELFWGQDRLREVELALGGSPRPIAEPGIPRAPIGRRRRSIARRRAAVVIHAAGLAGTPSRRHTVTAASKAS